MNTDAPMISELVKYRGLLGMLAWRDIRVRYIRVFKNQGAPAGATLEHSHSQLIALPIVPDYVKDEIEGARQHFT